MWICHYNLGAGYQTLSCATYALELEEYVSFQNRLWPPVRRSDVNHVIFHIAKQEYLLGIRLHDFVCEDTGFFSKIAGLFRKNYQVFPQTGKCTFRLVYIGYNSAVEGAMTRPVHASSRKCHVLSCDCRVIDTYIPTIQY